jgi:hypothetical protein
VRVESVVGGGSGILSRSLDTTRNPRPASYHRFLHPWFFVYFGGSKTLIDGD